MDKRRKILVVEDEDSARETLVAILEREDVRVESCGSLADACSAIREMRFDLALVDIMLAGPHDRANRDGLEILTRIKEAGEGTTMLVLSAQPEVELVVDVWKEYGAHGYISKAMAEREGLAFLQAKVREGLDASVPPLQGRDWNALLHALAPGEAALGLVHDILRKATFGGGLPVLGGGLLESCKWLVPLVAPSDDQGLGPDPNVPGAFWGVYWSRGQGCAVQIVVHGTNADAAELDGHFGAGKFQQMHQRTKGGLTISVLARPDLSYSQLVAG